MNDTSLQLSEPAARPAPMPKIKMDRSRSYGTVHGSIAPGQPYFGAAMIQDGLYFDAQGHLLIEHPDYEGDTPAHEKLRKVLAKKIERHMRDAGKRQATVNAEGGPDMPRGIDEIDDDDEVAAEEDLEPLNLTEWAAGRQQVEWNDITQAIAQRYKKRVASIADAIPFLVKEGMIQPDQVAKKYRRYLD